MEATVVQHCKVQQQTVQMPAHFHQAACICRAPPGQGLREGGGQGWKGGSQ